MDLWQFSAVGVSKEVLVKMKLLLIVCLAGVASCAMKNRAPDATVDFVPGNDQISGRLNLYRSRYAGVLIYGQVSGLSPGLHGFHVHAVGDLSERCTAAGGHFNPYETTHGSPYDNPNESRHAGDLGNIYADRYGNANIHRYDSVISLDRDSPAYIGNLAIVVHQGQDDLGRGGNADSLRTGNAGGRAGCGLIVHH